MAYKNLCCGLYTIKNKINGKVYYGSSSNIPKRWRYHRSDLRRGKHGNPRLQNAWNKYGEDAFAFSVFAYCAKENLLDYEQILLDLYAGEDFCYNIAIDAASGMLGRTHSKETRTKISEALAGRTLSEDHKQKLSAAKKGENHPNWGKTHSEETKRKMAEARKGKTMPKLTCPHCNKTSDIGNIKRWHFDNCKLRQKQ